VGLWDCWKSLGLDCLERPAKRPRRRACEAAWSRKVEEEVEEEEEEKHSEPACPWEAACTAAVFVTPHPSLRLGLLLRG